MKMASSRWSKYAVDTSAAGGDFESVALRDASAAACSVASAPATAPVGAPAASADFMAPNPQTGFHCFKFDDENEEFHLHNRNSSRIETKKEEDEDEDGEEFDLQFQVC